MAGKLAFIATMRPRILNGRDFKDHDGTATWHDGGDGDAIAAAVRDALADKLRIYVGNQVKDAVHEYITNGTFSLTLIDGEAHIVFSVSNPAIAMAATIKLADILAQGHLEGDTLMNRALDRALDYVK